MFSPDFPAEFWTRELFFMKKALFFFFLIGNPFFQFSNQDNFEKSEKQLDKMQKFLYDDIVNSKGQRSRSIHFER